MGPATAIGSVVFRTIEAVMYLLGVVGLLTLAALSGSTTTGEATSSSTMRSLVEVLTSVRREAGLVAVFAFAVGAFMYYALMYQARLVPVWLSGWGLLAVGLPAVAALLAVFTGPGVSEYKALAPPIFVQELVLGVGLLLKGFTTPEHPVGNPARSRDTDHEDEAWAVGRDAGRHVETDVGSGRRGGSSLLGCEAPALAHPGGCRVPSALSIRYGSMSAQAAVGGLLVGVIVSWALLRFRRPIPGRTSMAKSLAPAFIVLLMVTVLVEAPASELPRSIRSAKSEEKRLSAASRTVSWLSIRVRRRVPAKAYEPVGLLR